MQLRLSKTMSNQELSEVFSFIAGVVSLNDTNRFRIRAYQNAASVIEQLPKELHEMFLNDPDFDKLPAIGEAIESKLVELFTTGRIKAFDKYTEGIPEGVWPLFRLHGLGVKKAYTLSQAFHLDKAETALSELLVKAREGKVQLLPGFAEKSEQELIGLLERSVGNTVKSERLPLEKAVKIANEMIEELKACEAVERIEALGSLRRQAPTVGDIDIGLVCRDVSLVKTCVKSMKSVKRLIADGDQVWRLEHSSGRQIDFKTVPASEWGSFIQHYTGSKEHNIKLREFALKQGKSLSEHGIKITNPKTNKEELLRYDSEEAFYNALGLSWIPPQDRKGGDEIAKAQKAKPNTEK